MAKDAEVAGGGALAGDPVRNLSEDRIGKRGFSADVPSGIAD